MRKLHIAFSGGRTSAYMTKFLLENSASMFDETVVVFANTGQEWEQTLEFVNNCDTNFNFNTVWVEAVIHPEKGIGTGHKVVAFDTASRNGEPFEAMIAKYGIPNRTWQICSRELKANTVRSYLRSIGWKKKDYYSAIGIRHDEIHRISANCERDRLVYPLAEWHKVDKLFINTWWAQQEFNLKLKEHQGNCKWCWKKSKRKLLTIAKETPEVFQFPAKMELLYGKAGNPNRRERAVFFQNYTSTLELLAEADKPFDKFVDTFHEDLDAPNGCDESCEVFV